MPDNLHVLLDDLRQPYLHWSGHDTRLPGPTDRGVCRRRVRPSVSELWTASGTSALNTERGPVLGDAESAAWQSAGSTEGRPGRAVLHQDQPTVADLFRLAGRSSRAVRRWDCGLSL